jgi:hypothetical protein
MDLYLFYPMASIRIFVPIDVDFWGLHKTAKAWYINTHVLNEMLKRVQHDKEKCVIPNLFRNLDFGNDNKSIAFVLVTP